MGCGFNDIYVLAQERSAAAAVRFLDEVVPQREQSADEYQFPEEASVPVITIRDATEAMHYCADRLHEAHRFYFRNTEGESPAHAMVFFTVDGRMVVGVSVPARQDDRHQEAVEIAGWLARLQSVTGGGIGYALFESPPPSETVDDFVQGLAIALPPKLVDGRLVLPKPDEDVGVVWLDWSR